MNLDETANRINNVRRSEQMEQKPATPYAPSEAMEALEEAKDYIRFLYKELQEQKEANKRMQDTL